MSLSVDQPQPVTKRAVFFIGGYDPKSPEAFFDRQERETGRFEKLWSVTVEEQSRETLHDDITRATYRAEDKDKNWSVQTDFNFLTLDDVVLSDFQDSFFKRLKRYTATFFNYVGSGTAHLFIRHAWRFAIYFFYPAFMLILALAISLFVGSLIGSLNLPLSNWVGLLAFVGCLAFLIRWGGKRYHVLHLMDLWSFSNNFLKGRQSAMNAKLDRFASEIVNSAKTATYDEIILIGHSTGGALILDAAGRAFEKDAEFAEGSTQINVLTVGSTALKIGLHPAADWYRERLTSLFSKASVQWIEYQCLSDVINFFKTNPAKLMGFDNKLRKPILTRKIKLKSMIAEPAYTKNRRRFFRIHYQFVFGNTLKYHYDYPAICYGPATLIDRATNPQNFGASLRGAPIEKDTQI